MDYDDMKPVRDGLIARVVALEASRNPLSISGSVFREAFLFGYNRELPKRDEVGILAWFIPMPHDYKVTYDESTDMYHLNPYPIVRGIKGDDIMGVKIDDAIIDDPVVHRMMEMEDEIEGVDDND